MQAQSSEWVIGVAGHIDHGKTSLVKALTGTDTDRLPEEKSRGITIELGFAQLELPNKTRASIIDMPGHEKFIRAMISGAGGIDVCLLVVAANEGVMPQTREHLAVAQLLGVRRAVIALSKCDLAGDDVLELAVEEVREVLASTIYADAPVIPVSAHSGRGLAELIAAIEALHVERRASDGPVVVPVDRVFVRKGFGVVITGTLISGTIHEGDALCCGPVGLEHTVHDVRVRGLQVHSNSVTEAHAGTRVAVNLAGVELTDISRGVWLYSPAEVAMTTAFDAEMTILASARKLLGRRSHFDLAIGAAHTECTVALLEGEELLPGDRALVRVTTDQPVLLRPNERFVLRAPPSFVQYGSTVGGGRVVRPIAERVKKRDLALNRAKDIAQEPDDVDGRLRIELEAAGPKGLSPKELALRVGVPITQELSDRAGLFAVGASRFVSQAVVNTSSQRVLQTLTAWHTQQPASRGIERRAMSQLGDEGLIDAVLLHLQKEKRVARDGELYCRSGWKPKDPDAVPHLTAVLSMITAGGLMPPRVDEMAKWLKVEPKILEPALKRLSERGSIVKLDPEFYADSAAVQELEVRLIAWLKAEQTIDAQGYKTLTGASRKWAIPLAEYFDGKKITIRVGDVRRLRGS